MFFHSFKLKLFHYIINIIWHTLNKLPQIWIHIDSTGHESLHISDGKSRRRVGQEELEFARVPVNLQQRLNLLGRRDLALYPGSTKDIKIMV